MSILQQVNALAKTNAQNKKITLPTTREGIRAMMGFVPRAHQEEILANRTRFRVDVCHRRFGKTVLFVNLLIEQALLCPFDDGEYAYAAPTYNQAEHIAWRYLVASTARIPTRRLTTSDLEVNLPTVRGGRSTIKLFGLDSPKQRMRGAYLDGVVIDETGQVPRHQWTDVVRPMLSDNCRAGENILGDQNQWAAFIGTPAGRNWFADLYENAKTWEGGGFVMAEDLETGKQTPQYSNEWSAGMYKASETGIITPAERQAMFREMGRAKYNQELECSFDAAITGAIYAEDIEALDEEGHICDADFIKGMPVNTAWDLGWDDATAVWFFQSLGSRILVFDYYETRKTSFPDIVQELRDRSGDGNRFRYGYHLLPPDVNVHEQGSGKTRKKILNELGLSRIIPVRPTKALAEDIAVARKFLYRCTFNRSRCQKGLTALRMYHRNFDEKLGVMSQTPVHDQYSHGATAFQTLAKGYRKDFGADSTDPNVQTHAEM